MQWDDDAAIALGISTRNQDRQLSHTVKRVSQFEGLGGESSVKKKWNETHRLRVSAALTGSLCAAFTRRHAICAAHSVSMPLPYALLTA